MCACVYIKSPPVCNIRGCESCSSSDCCSQCEDGYEVDRESTCLCGKLCYSTTMVTSFIEHVLTLLHHVLTVISTSSSSVSPSPSKTNPAGRSQRLNSNILAGL